RLWVRSGYRRTTAPGRIAFLFSGRSFLTVFWLKGLNPVLYGEKSGCFSSCPRVRFKIMDVLDALAALVRERPRPLLAEWRKRVRAAIPNRREFDKLLLDDDIQNFLDELSNALLLQAHDPGASPEEAIEFSSVVHAVQRFQLKGRIEELVLEYG